MKSIIRSIVASPKQSHYDPKLNLLFDFSYITPQLIVSSGPVNTYLKSFYRYPVEDMVRFLNANHKSNWHIWNFRGEEPGYSDQDVLNKVSHFPFPDHQPPTIEIILQSVKEIEAFLDRSSKNVAVLHCKAGKGRSGTICCAYMVYRSFNVQQVIDINEAIGYFTHKRMRGIAGDGVSIYSQKRYLDYWFEYLKTPLELRDNYHDFNKNMSMFDPNKSCITMIRINNPSTNFTTTENGIDFNLELEAYFQRPDNVNGVEIKEIYQLSESEIRKSTGKHMIIVPEAPISLSSSKDLRISIKKWCFSWFNIYFETLHSNNFDLFAIDSLPDNSQFVKGHYTGKWENLDGFNGTRQRGMKLFESIDVCWRLYY